jgi:site-specific recombinase XerD
MIIMKNDITINESINNYLSMIKYARSENTYRTYKNGIHLFGQMLEDNGLDIKIAKSEDLTEHHFALFVTYLKNLSPSTERLYLTTIKGFYEFLSSEGVLAFNLQRIQLLIRQRARKPGQRLPQFPKSNINIILEQVEQLKNKNTDNINDRLINFRDRAFLICLADTGLRVHEACKLRRGEIDWFESRALVIGKGNREDIVRFSERSLNALREYISIRATLDGASGLPLASLPLFARHDKGAGKKIKPITTATGRNIVNNRVSEFLGDDAVGTITPHSFRHYFVTKVLQGSGNLKLAQSLARHKNIAITQRYAHINDDELDRGYKEIFE